MDFAFRVWLLAFYNKPVAEPAKFVWSSPYRGLDNYSQTSPDTVTDG